MSDEPTPAAKSPEEVDADEWDRQIEADIKAGKLDELVERALRDHAAGRTREL
jgi:hypothetical protein